MNILNKCNSLVSFVIITLLISLLGQIDSVFSQGSGNGSNSTMSGGDSRSPINITALVINSTESVKNGLIELDLMVQNGDIPKAIQKINEINETVNTLEGCVTSDTIDFSNFL